MENKQDRNTGCLEGEDINLKNPFTVMRKYQGKMMSRRTKHLWKKVNCPKSITQYITDEISKVYTT